MEEETEMIEDEPVYLRDYAHEIFRPLGEWFNEEVARFRPVWTINLLVS